MSFRHCFMDTVSTQLCFLKICIKTLTLSLTLVALKLLCTSGQLLENFKWLLPANTDCIWHQKLEFCPNYMIVLMFGNIYSMQQPHIWTVIRHSTHMHGWKATEGSNQFWNFILHAMDTLTKMKQSLHD